MELFRPLELGALSLRNRVVMAPMTRSRAEEGAMPGQLMVDYYAPYTDYQAATERQIPVVVLDPA